MAQSFWDAAAPLISSTERHPFLVSMVDGTLHLENFQYYVIQDALYLTDFAACLHLLGDKMANVNEVVSHRLHRFAIGAEQDEKELHRSFFKRWNIDAIDATPMPNTRELFENTIIRFFQIISSCIHPWAVLYTSYMIRIVATRPVEEGFAVLLPCFWVYMHVGKCMLALRKKLGDSVHRPPQYDAWIDMYGGEEFETEVNEFIALVDGVVESADIETKQRMKEHFMMSCKLEYLFWDQAQYLVQWSI